MIKRYYALGLVVGILVAFTGCGASRAFHSRAAGTIALSKDVEVRKLTDSVWLHTSFLEHNKFGRVGANGIIVVDSGEACMIDLPWNDNQTGLLFDWIGSYQDARVTKVVPTHSHTDCAGGLNEAHRRGADSYAVDKTVHLLKNTNYGVPKNSFADEVKIKCGAVEVMLAYRGGGHTLDNIVAWVESEKVLFGGCLIKPMATTERGNVSQADVARWPITVQKIKDEFVSAKIVVPGHGASGGDELLGHTIELFSGERDVGSIGTPLSVSISR